MRITADIIKHEFIGTEGKVVESRNADNVGIKGRVVDETKSTLSILQKGKMKKIIKETAIFHFKFPDNTIVEIDGKLLTGRPEDRLKKNLKRLW